MKYFFFIFFSINSFAQVLFEGEIKNALTKENLAGASIYVPNSTYGTFSDIDGKFSLQLPTNTKEIVISYIGYHTIHTKLDLSDGKNFTKVILLRENKNQLKEVVVIKQKQDKKWFKMYETFKNQFIGNSAIARNTEILNPEDLVFNEEIDSLKSKYKLTANANKPLLIKNKVTGYIITYDLIQFNFITLGHNQSYTFYLGYPFFKDITQEEKLKPEKVAKKRLETYLGSSMHFIRALYNNTLYEEGFTVQKLSKTINLNHNNPEIINKYNQSLTNKDYQAVRMTLNRENITLDKSIVPISKFTSTENEKKYIYFEDYLNVTYTKVKPDKTYQNSYNNSPFQVSQLKIENERVEYFADGNYYNPSNLFFFGYMGWKKVGDMLPFDFQP